MLAIPATYMLAGIASIRSGSDRLLGASHVLIALFVALAPVAAAVKARQAYDASLGARHPAILDALEFMNDVKVPAGSFVIAEDEMLNYVIVKDPDYFAGARSIQSFNIMSADQRREALSQARYVYISKRRNYGWNYLFYFPKATWVTDIFRANVLNMIEANKPRSVLGSVLEPIYNSDTGFTARIRPDARGETGTK